MTVAKTVFAVWRGPSILGTHTPCLRQPTSSYRRHGASGQAVFTIQGEIFWSIRDSCGARRRFVPRRTSEPRRKPHPSTAAMATHRKPGRTQKRKQYSASHRVAKRKPTQRAAFDAYFYRVCASAIWEYTHGTTIRAATRIAAGTAACNVTGLSGRRASRRILGGSTASPTPGASATIGSPRFARYRFARSCPLFPAPDAV